MQRPVLFRSQPSYLLIFVLGVMTFAFVSALYIALTTPTTKGTIGKRRTAENILKMTGSFFVGFATALLKY